MTDRVRDARRLKAHYADVLILSL